VGQMLMLGKSRSGEREPKDPNPCSVQTIPLGVGGGKDEPGTKTSRVTC